MNRLKSLKIDELSLCDRPANKSARVAIFKAAAPPPPPQSDEVTAGNELRQLAMQECDRSGCDFSTGINRVLQTPKGRKIWARTAPGKTPGPSMKLEQEMDISKSATLECTMDVLAEMHARDNKMSKVAAYNELLKSDADFRELYGELRVAMSNPSEIRKRQAAIDAQVHKNIVAKIAVTGAEAELDRLAKAYAQSNRVSFAKAYDAVLETEAGRTLYAKHRDERMTAGV